MNDYIVTWRVYVPAETPEEAARMARRIMKSHGISSNFFQVKDEGTGIVTGVDLDD